MSFKQLEINFQRNLNEYKSTFKDYMVELNKSRGTYWHTEENVTVSNRDENARIPFLTETDISKSKCLYECASDPKCDYVLFSDSGNGGCAANQCIKWTKEAGGIIKANNKPRFFNIFVGSSLNSRSKTIQLPEPGIKVYPKATNAQESWWPDRFKVNVDGSRLTVTRIDADIGWGQQLQLQGVKDAGGFQEYMINVGPSSTNPKVVTIWPPNIDISPTPINYQDPDWNNTFHVEVSGQKVTVTRTDQNSGWGQNLQLRGVIGNSQGFTMENKGCAPGEGPFETNYVYSGWEKPQWKDSNNVSFMGTLQSANPGQWKDLGNATSLVACKDMSVISPKGPFSSVVFVSQENKCYGGVPGAPQEMVQMEGVYSSIPPMGSTNMGGSAVLLYLEKLKNLNNALKNDLMQMREVLKRDEAKVKEDPELIRETEQQIRTDFRNLDNDRIKIDELQRELNNLDVKLGLLDRVTSREKVIYLGSAAAFLIVVFAFMYRKYS